MSRCSATKVACFRLDFMATSVATGIQSAFGRCKPKAMVTAMVTASALINTNRTTCLLSLVSVTSPGISGMWVACSFRPRSNHTTRVKAIQSAEPASQANPCSHQSDRARSRCSPAGTDTAMRNHTLRSSAAVYRWRPNFSDHPAKRVTRNTARTTHPHGPPPMAKPSPVSSAPRIPTSAMPRIRIS
jgi:hypothetical protein